MIVIKAGPLWCQYIWTRLSFKSPLCSIQIEWLTLKQNSWVNIAENTNLSMHFSGKRFTTWRSTTPSSGSWKSFTSRCKWWKNLCRNFSKARRKFTRTWREDEEPLIGTFTSRKWMKKSKNSFGRTWPEKLIFTTFVGRDFTDNISW